MVKKIVLVFAMIATVIGLWASIERKDEKGMMPEFEKIVVNASIRLSIVHGDSLSVRIHGDNDDVYDFIDCKVKDKSLVITSNDATNSTIKGAKAMDITAIRTFFKMQI